MLDCVDTAVRTGIVKKFIDERGFGFISQNDGPDALLHIERLREAGYESARQGSTVTYTVKRKGDGKEEVSKVVSVDESTVVSVLSRELTEHKAALALVLPLCDGFEQATCTWFNPYKGFGFLTRGEGTPDIFVHAVTLRLFGMTKLSPDQAVLMRYGQGPKGLVAIEVRLPE